MAKFPYTPSIGRLTDFLDKIQSVSPPPEVTKEQMASLGFGSSNDAYTRRLLAAMGFIDSTGVPTERWRSHRVKAKAPLVLADGIKDAYSELFDTYPDAHLIDDGALKSFFIAKETVSEKTVGRIVATFKALCERADFSAVASEAPKTASVVPPTAEPRSEAAAAPVLRKETVTTQGVTVNVNIQLTLPETKDSAIYDAIFESLKKHILSQD